MFCEWVKQCGFFIYVIVTHVFIDCVNNMND